MSCVHCCQNSLHSRLVFVSDASLGLHHPLASSTGTYHPAFLWPPQHPQYLLSVTYPHLRWWQGGCTKPWQKMQGKVSICRGKMVRGSTGMWDNGCFLWSIGNCSVTWQGSSSNRAVALSILYVISKIRVQEV